MSLPTLTLKWRNPRENQPRASSAMREGSPIGIVMSETSERVRAPSEPPSNVRRGMPSSRAHASRIAVSSAARATGLSASAPSSASERSSSAASETGRTPSTEGSTKICPDKLPAARPSASRTSG